LHPPHDLDASRTAMAYFGACEVYKILPVRCPENGPQFAGGIADILAAELPQTDPPEQTVKLIDGEYGRCRIIDGRRFGLRNRAMALLMATVGLRAGEVANLKLEDIDWRKSSIEVHNTKSCRIDYLLLAQR
jgi:integrase